MNFIEVANQCMPTDVEMIQIFGKNNSQARERGTTALLQMLYSNENRNQIRISDAILGSAQGKKNPVRIMTTSPYCFKVCNTENNCNVTMNPITPAVTFFEYGIETMYTPCVGDVENSALTFDVIAFEEYCKIDDGMFLKEQITLFDDRFVKELDKVIMNALQPLVNVANVKTIPITIQNTLTASLQINSQLYLQLFNIVKGAGYDLSDYFIIGGTMVNQIASILGIVTYSFEGGQVTSNKTNLPAMYYDDNFDAVFGANQFLMIPKGALQLVDYQKYKGMRKFNGETQKFDTKGIILGNNNVLSVDYRWKLDPDCTKIEYMPSVFMELVQAIPGNCTSEDENGIFLIKDCNANPLPICV